MPGDDRDFLVVKKKRDGYRLNILNECRKADALLEQGDTADPEKICLSQEKLNKYQEKINELDEQVLSLVPIEAVNDEVTKSLEVQERLLDYITQLQLRQDKLRKQQQCEQDVDQLSVAETTASKGSLSPNTKLSVKLPKLNIEKFDGNPLNWQGFWDSYDTTFHSNTDISDIDKFKYLKCYLSGEALRVAEGYRLTAANYHAVIEALTERYGDPEVAIFAHFDELLALPLSGFDTAQLQLTFDECEKHIRCLVALGLEEGTFGRVFTPIILSKLPRAVRVELHRKNGSTTWELSRVREFLKNEILAREKGDRSFGEHSTTPRHILQQSKFQSSMRKERNKCFKSTSEALYINSQTQKKNRKCSYCKDFHFTDQCKKYPDINTRKTQLRNRCYACLRTGHNVKECPQPMVCFYCQRLGHHRSLCPTQYGSNKVERSEMLNIDASSFVPPPIPTVSLPAPTLGQSPPNLLAPPVVTPARYMPVTISSTSSTMLSHGEQVLLQTAVATISDISGTRQVKARILFDTGCSRSFIKQRTAAKIGLKPKREEIIAMAGFGDTERKVQKLPVVDVTVNTLDGSTCTLTVNISPQISCPILKYPLCLKEYPILTQLQLAEPLNPKTEQIDIDLLIGIDYYYDLVGPHQLMLSEGLVLIQSKLGFIATGRVMSNLPKDSYASTMFLSQNTITSLDADMERLWRLDEIGIKDNPTVVDDDLALKQFLDTVQFEDGRYQIAWPWKMDASELPTNYELAYGRLKSLLRRLTSQPELFRKYDSVIQEQLKLQIIENVTPSCTVGERIYYMPHHCVVRPDRTTTKVRIVFDASSKPKQSDRSLNECLYRGPVYLENLCGLLLRFRLYPIAIISDIEKAFLQVAIQEKERDVTRFLWLADITKPYSSDNLVTYRFCRVPFGIIASPFMLAATIRHHLRLQKSLISTEIAQNVYVDNILVGRRCTEDAKRFYDEAKSIFAAASMNLREWCSNDVELTEYIPKRDRATGNVAKVFGLVWKLDDDTILVGKSQLSKYDTVTKRQLVKNSAEVFDPLEYFAPVTISAKQMIQDLWKEKYPWDEPLPQVFVRKWNQIYNDLAQLCEHALPRYIQTFKAGEETYDLHAFCDASGRAYAAAVYLKVGPMVNLLFCKVRLAPIKSVSLPRLELMAVVIGIRALAFVRQELRLPINRMVIWSDSQCVLSWISSRKLMPVFVENRLREIRKVEGVDFRYVSTSENPADIPSRGTGLAKLLKLPMWWNGPRWLAQDELSWPLNLFVSPNKECISEASVMPLVLSETASPMNIDIKRYSSLYRLLRVTAYALKFTRLLRIKRQEERTKTKDKRLVAEDIREAELIWIKFIQKDAFGKEIWVVQNKGKSDLTQKFRLFLDKDGLLRCGGRFRNSSLPIEAKFPILIPRKSTFTDLVIMSCHEKTHHSGVNHTLSELRQIYWVLQGRSQVQRVLKNCLVCRRAEGGPFQIPESPPLPHYRVSEVTPFSHVGIDYFGPLYVNHLPLKETKAWVSLFTCTATRAIHLEVVQDMSTEEFILALRRFISIYGKPELIISDNAKHFKLANVCLVKFWENAITSSELQDYMTKENIKWKYIVELAPWMGGFYERLVQSVKRALKKSVGRRLLTLVQLQTVISEISAVVNSRPLVYIGNDNDNIILTPGHFLSRNPYRCLPQISSDSDPAYKSKQHSSAEELFDRWRRGDALLNEFWNTWRKDYLLSLRERDFQWKQRNASPLEPVIGSVVLIKEPLPRPQWKIGRVTELVTSADGFCRAAKIVLPNKHFLTRPLKLLYPIECPSENEEYKETGKYNKDKRIDLVKESAQTRQDERTDRNQVNLVQGQADNSKDRCRPLRLSALKASAKIAELSRRECEEDM